MAREQWESAEAAKAQLEQVAEEAKLRAVRAEQQAADDEVSRERAEAEAEAALEVAAEAESNLAEAVTSS